MESIYSIIHITVTLTLESALSIGTGESRRIGMEEDGRPYIPGTSLAGVLRHSMDSETGDRLFGKISVARNHKEKALPSRIFVGDGVLTSEGWTPVFRDGVMLDEYRTASGTSKYATFAVDRGAEFTSHIELEFANEQEECTLFAPMLAALAKLGAGESTMGKKSRRGFGQLSVKACTMRAYRGAELLMSLDHRREDETPFALPCGEQSDYESIQCAVALRDTLCVREYMPLIYRGASKREPNYVQMTSGGQPVIPGTSWAGIFRHGAQRVLFKLGIPWARSEQLIGELFGRVEGDQLSASLVHFSDTFFPADGNIRRGTRTAINRSSGGAANNALYTEDILVADGAACTGLMRIRVRRNMPCTGWGTELMYLLLTELDEGRLCAGGGASIGRGLLRVPGIKKRAYPELAKLVRRECGSPDKKGDEGHV